MLLLTLLLLPACYNAMTTVLLSSGESTCVNLEAAQDTVLRVDYEAPDLPNDDNDDYAPAYIKIHVSAADGRVMDTKHHAAPVRSHLKPTKELLRQPKGSVRHTMEVDGIATLCIMAPTIHERNRRQKQHERFYRFGFRVLTTEEDYAASADAAAAAAAPKADVDSNLGYMEKEIARIERAMKNLLREADFAKDRDAAMHQQFLAMHSTTFYWPVMHCCVLLVTGFTQASHIVRFFQSRRII